MRIGSGLLRCCAAGWATRFGCCARTMELVAARQLGEPISRRQFAQADAALQHIFGLRCRVGHLSPGNGAHGERVDGGRAQAQQRELTQQLLGLGRVHDRVAVAARRSLAKRGVIELERLRPASPRLLVPLTQLPAAAVDTQAEGDTEGNKECDAHASARDRP